MKLTDKIIASISPGWAVARAESRAKLSRYESAYPSNKRRSQSGCKDASGKSKNDTKEKKNLRLEASQLLKNNSIVKYAFRDAQTYLAPTGWVAQTGNTDLNKKIRRLVNGWMREADVTGKNHLLDLFAIGCGMQIIDGDMGLGLISQQGFGLKTQAIRASRIGAPAGKYVKFNDLEAKKKLKDLEKEGLYYNGVESDESGKVVRYWIFTERQSDITGTEWVFDKTFEANNFLPFNDPIDIDEERGVTEFAQSVADMIDHDESMGYVKQKVKAQSKRLGTWSSPYGDTPENPIEEGADESGERDVVTRIEMDDDIDVLAIDSDYEFKPWNQDVPNGTFGEFMAKLITSPAFSLHLPHSSLGIKNKQLQGTDVRSDNSKAQTEYERKRERHDRNVYTPLIEAQLAYWHAAGEFKEFEDATLFDVLRGRWAYRKDLTVDEGYRSGKMIAEAKMGWTNDADVARMKGVDEEQMKEGRKTQVDELLTDTAFLANKHGVSMESVLRLMKDQNLGTVPPVQDDPPPPQTVEIDAD